MKVTQLQLVKKKKNRLTRPALYVDVRSCREKLRLEEPTPVENSSISRQPDPSSLANFPDGPPENVAVGDCRRARTGATPRRRFTGFRESRDPIDPVSGTFGARRRSGEAGARALKDGRFRCESRCGAESAANQSGPNGAL